MSSQRTKYVVLCDPDDTEPHICGVFVELPAALKCIDDDHVDTGTPLARYTVEQWRGRQFNGAYSHDGALVEKHDGELVEQHKSEGVE